MGLGGVRLVSGRGSVNVVLCWGIVGFGRC